MDEMKDMLGVRLVEKVFVGNILMCSSSLKKLCWEFLGLDEK